MNGDGLLSNARRLVCDILSFKFSVKFSDSKVIAFPWLVAVLCGLPGHTRAALYCAACTSWPLRFNTNEGNHEQGIGGGRSCLLGAAIEYTTGALNTACH